MPIKKPLYGITVLLLLKGTRITKAHKPARHPCHTWDDLENIVKGTMAFLPLFQ